MSKLRCRRRCSEVHLSPLFSLLLNFCRWFLLENLHMTKQSYVVVNIDNKKETSFKWLCCRAITSKKPKTPMDNYGDYGYSPTIEQSRQSNKGKTHFTISYELVREIPGSLWLNLHGHLKNRLGHSQIRLGLNRKWLWNFHGLHLMAIYYMRHCISNSSPPIVNRPLTDQEIDKSYKVGWVSSTLILFGSVCCIGWDIKMQTTSK